VFLGSLGEFGRMPVMR
jgi:transposase